VSRRPGLRLLPPFNQSQILALTDLAAVPLGLVRIVCGRAETGITAKPRHCDPHH